LALGIVNDEMVSFEECRNHSIESIHQNCTFETVSCRFIEELDEDIVKLVSANSTVLSV
jgi:hypothetical protein